MNKPTWWCKSGRVSLVCSSCLYKTQPERALAQVCHTRIDALSPDEYQFHLLLHRNFPSFSSNISKVIESLMNLENHGEMFLEPSACIDIPSRRTDGHCHGIIHPFFKRVYKNQNVPSMFLCANNVPYEINKWIAKIIIKNSHIGIRLKTYLMFKVMISSQNVQNLKALT